MCTPRERVVKKGLGFRLGFNHLLKIHPNFSKNMQRNITQDIWNSLTHDPISTSSRMRERERVDLRSLMMVITVKMVKQRLKGFVNLAHFLLCLSPEDREREREVFPVDEREKGIDEAKIIFNV